MEWQEMGHSLALEAAWLQTTQQQLDRCSGDTSNPG